MTNKMETSKSSLMIMNLHLMENETFQFWLIRMLLMTPSFLMNNDIS